jgi:hypothetical protein
MSYVDPSAPTSPPTRRNSHRERRAPRCSRALRADVDLPVHRTQAATSWGDTTVPRRHQGQRGLTYDHLSPRVAAPPALTCKNGDFGRSAGVVDVGSDRFGATLGRSRLQDAPGLVAPGSAPASSPVSRAPNAVYPVAFPIQPTFGAGVHSSASPNGPRPLVDGRDAAWRSLS